MTNLHVEQALVGPDEPDVRVDVLACPRCGGRLRLIALIEQAAVIDRILGHLGLPAEIPAPLKKYWLIVGNSSSNLISVIFNNPQV